MDQHGQRPRMLGRPLTRRRMLQGSLAAGGALAASGIGAGRGPWFVRGAQEGGFEGEASIVSWGFGAPETDPLAFARFQAFQQAFPNIKVELVVETNDEKILTAAASDTLPDVVWADRFATAQWASNETWQPLADLVERDSYDTGRFYEAALAEASYDGTLYGIPGSMDVQILYVNLDHLAEAGVDPNTVDTGNWEQLIELGGSLVKRSGDRVERWGFDHKMQDGFIYLWGGVNGGDFINDDGTEVTFDDPKIVEAVDWGVRTYDAQGGFQSYEAVRSTWQGDEQFARGQVAMTMYQSWMMSGILTRVAPELNFKILPVMQRGGEGMYSVLGGRAWYITKNAKNVDAAWEFIKFMNADETWLIGANARKAQRQEEGVAYVPSLTGAKTADQAQIDQVYEPVEAKFDEAVRLFPQLVESGRPREVYVSPAGSLIDQRLDTAGTKPALRKELPPADALQRADQDAQDELDFL